MSDSDEAYCNEFMRYCVASQDTEWRTIRAQVRWAYQRNDLQPAPACVATWFDELPENITVWAAIADTITAIRSIEAARVSAMRGRKKVAQDTPLRRKYMRKYMRQHRSQLKGG